LFCIEAAPANPADPGGSRRQFIKSIPPAPLHGGNDIALITQGTAENGFDLGWVLGGHR